MNRETDKTKEQLITELEELRNESKNQAKKLLVQNKELDAKVLQRTKELEKSEHHYKMLFNESPVPTWEEDFSQCKTYIDTLKKRNIKNFREYFDNNPNDIIEAINKVIIIDVNNAAIKLHEAQSKQELLHSLTSIFTNKSYEAAKEQLICIAEGINEYESEAIVKTIAGIEKNILLKWSVIPGYEGTLEKVYVTTIDITERKQAEDKLKESEDRLSKTMMAANDGIWEWDLKTNKVYFDPRYYQMADYDVDEFPHQLEELKKRLHPEDIDYVLNEAQKHLEDKTDRFIVEFRFKKKNGEWLWVRGRGLIVERDKNKAPLRFIGTHSDITERKLAEHALQESELKFRNLSEATNMGIGLFQNDYWIYANPAAEEISGYSFNELKQMKFWEFVAPEYVDLIKEQGRARQNGKRATSGYEFKIITKQGKEKWVLLTGNTTDLKSGKAGLITVLDITKRKQEKKEIRKLSRVVESTKQAIIISDLDTNIVYVNPALLNLGGFNNKNELIGKSFLAYTDDKSKTKLQDEIIPAILKDGFYDGEITIKKKDKSLYPAEINCSLFTDETGASVYFTAFFEDITKRKETEKALTESEEKYRKIFENVQDIFYQVDSDGKIIEISPSIKRYSGYSREELIGISVKRTYYNPNDSYILKAELEKKGEVIDYEIRLKTKYDQLIYVSLNAHILYDENKNPAGIEGSLRDITKRKNAEKALKKSEEKYRKIFENSPSGIMMIDENGFIHEANATISKITGYPIDDLIGSDVTRLIVPNNRKLVNQNIKRILSGEILEQEIVSCRKDGSYCNLILRETTIKFPNGKKGILSISNDITKQKSAEAKLNDSEKKYRELSTLLRLMANNMPDMIWAKNLKKEFIFVNKSICSGLLNAKTTEEPLGKTDMFFATRERNSHPDNSEWHTFGELCMDSDTVTLEAMKPMRFDEYGNVKGKFLFLDVYKAPLYDADGQLIGTVGSARDITIAKEAETKLRKLSTAVTQSPAAIMITDTEGKLEYVNPKFTEITGYSREEVIGQNTRILQSGEHSNEMYKELWQTVSSGKNWQGEMHNKKKNGELFWSLSSISPIFDEKGDIINYVDVAEDITDRKRNEETQKILLEISKTTNQYNSLFDFLEIIHQKIKSVLRADNFYVALYNQDDSTYSFPYHVDEIDNIELNKPYDFSNGLTDFVFKSNRSMIITPNDHEKMKNNAIKGYGDVKSVWLGVPLKPSDQSKAIGVIVIQDYKNKESYTEGDKAVFEIIAYHIFGFIQRIKYLEDIITAKQKAEESDRLKSAFLANMSHEIRTPMNGILGFADLLKEPNLSGVELQNYVEIIEKSGKRMLNIINDIVDISKIESGLMEFHTQETNVNEQLEYIYTFFKPEAESKGIELYFKNNYIAKEVIIKTDREKLYAILTNLVKNAIKYTNYGSIEFGYNLKRNHRAAELEFYVKDTGIGVPKDRQKAIFERFMQAEIDDKMARQGAGLGLAITKAYVERLGGKIWVESNENKRTDGMEEGSIFYFTLPYNPEQKTENDKQDVIIKNSKTMRKLKILVAEDDKVSEMLIDNFIKPFSKTVLKAKTGVEAVEACRNNPDIELVLMDIRMPEMGGYKATKLIREFNKELIIIAQTAYGLAGDREKSIDAGCNDYISKPISKDKLFALIQKYFGN